MLAIIEAWHVWIVIGIILFIGEMFTPAFLLGSLGIGAWAAAIAAGFGMPFAGQVAAFIVTMVVVFFMIRPFFTKTLSRFDQPLKTGVQALIGRDALVIEAIDNITNRGRVKIGGETWKARSVDGQPIPDGTHTVVDRMEGVTVFVTSKE
jgi:membrane protein implicated in regulation of membrane protease activity